MMGRALVKNDDTLVVYYRMEGMKLFPKSNLGIFGHKIYLCYKIAVD